MKNWYRENTDSTFDRKRAELIRLLQEESKLLEIVKLIGSDILPEEQKLVLEISKVIRQGFLQQNAYHRNDTYVPVKKQYFMMDIILVLYNESKKLVEKNIPVSVIRKTGIFEEIIRMKYTIDNEEMKGFEELAGKILSILKEINDDYASQERKSLI